MSTTTSREHVARSPLYSEDSERAVLGAILLDPSLGCYNQAAAMLAPDDFFLDSNRQIFARMADRAENGRPIDLVTVAEELARRNELELIGGAVYLSHLTDGMPRLINIEHYAKNIKDNAQRRQLVLSVIS